MNPMKPAPSLLCKLGSVAVHADELLSPTGHDFDRVALSALLADAEVVEWIEYMTSLQLVPVKRAAPPKPKKAGSRKP